MPSIKVFPLVFTLLVFLSSHLTAAVYEDAEDGNTAGWSVYDNTPSGAQIRNAYDNNKGSNVIQLQGSSDTNNGYLLGGREGSVNAWGDSSSTTIKWSMKYSEPYVVYIRVMTTNGARYIQYTGDNNNRGGDDEYVKLGLGPNTHNGTWQTFTRDLQADLEQFQPGNTITQINGFYIRGSGFVDDISVGNTPPVTKDMNLSTVENTPISFALTATDADRDTIVSFPVFTSPSHGTLSGPEDNITYTPNQGFIGTDTFTYKANDGKDYSLLSTVSIEVFPRATAVHDDYSTTYMTRIDGNLFTNDLGLNIRISTFDTSNIQHGSITVNSDGTFHYTPYYNFDGNESFTYTIHDEFNNTSTTDVNITVLAQIVDLSIVKTAPFSVEGGEEIDYTLSIHSQNGAQYSTTRNVRVVDDLPLGVTFRSITAPSGWNCPSPVGGTVICDATYLPAGYNGTIVIHTYAPNSIRDLNNTASISGDIRDIDPSNNKSSTTTHIEPKDIDLTLTKTVSQPMVSTSTRFTYTLTVSNTGSIDAEDVSLTDLVDDKTTVLSVNGGNNWVCTQGSQDILCKYNGLISANTTARPITITVMAPPNASTISNTATVKSSSLESDTTNNSDTVSVSIISGTDVLGSEDLTLIYQKRLHGDFALIANTNINSNQIANYNDDVNMQYVDTDNDADTFNSSSSTLQIDDNYTVIWAGLFWQGHICSFDFVGTITGGGGCDWGNSSYANYNAAMANNNLGKIRFRAPGGDYQTIQASSINTIQRGTLLDLTYSSFAEVTNIVASAGSGTYWAADIVLTEGQRGGGNYGGWALVTVYEDPNSTIQYKDISIFKGFQYINRNNVPLNIDGFITPRSGPVTASMAFFSADGDPVAGGVVRMQNSSGAFTALSNNANPSNNTLNSTITNFGTAINPGVTKTYGIDADRFNVSSFMKNSQTSTNFLFDGALNGNNDYFTMDMFAFATDLTTPKIDELVKRSYLLYRDGTRVESNPTKPIYPGMQLEYLISFTNTGDEIAEGVEIFDDFDNDGLSAALDVERFDLSQLKLYHASDMSNEVPNTNCRYYSLDRRVSCKINTLEIGDTYTMRFVVSVRNQLNPSLLNKNATNTAYAKYRNPNTNGYINKYTTPTGEKVGGKSNALTSGVFQNNNNPNHKFITIDAINQFYTYEGADRDRNITTKIVNSDFNLTLVHRDVNKTQAHYQAFDTNLPLNVIITLNANGKVTQPLNNPAANIFQNNINQIIAQNIRIPKANKGDRLKLSYIDWKSLLESTSSTSPCRNFGSNQSHFTGLLPCFYSYEQVQELLPPVDFPNLPNCYSESGISPTLNRPCDPAAHSNPARSIEPYNHSYGCFQCITESASSNLSQSPFIHLSTDDFAVKPDHFEINSSNPSFPDLLRAGEDYNISIVARDGLGNPTKEYNTTDSLVQSKAKFYRSLTSGPNDTFNANTLDDENFTITFPLTFKISDGETNTTSMPSINYPNVAIRNIGFTDPYWASQTDRDDTPEECNATKNANHITIETGRNICTKDDAKVRFIPHHFNVTAKLHNHRDDSNVTYLSSDLDMSAHIETTIQAMNAQEQVTTNFKKDFYENPMTVDFNVTDWNTSLVANLPFDRNGTERPDVDIERHGIIKTPTLLGFGENNDTNGTLTIAIKDTNTTRRLMFNYKRDTTTPKNPFTINGQEVNLTVHSTYTTTMDAPERSADINGTGLASGKASFYYAQIRPDSKYYERVKTKTQSTPMFIDIYCDSNSLTKEGCQNRGIDTDNTGYSDNHGKWWLSRQHTMSKNDGNVTLAITSDVTKGTLNKTTMNTTNAKDGNITVTNEVNMTNQTQNIVEVSTVPDSTSSWLLDDNNTLTEVEFINDGNTTGSANSMWTGHGNTGNVVDGTSNRGTNNRLGW